MWRRFEVQLESQMLDGSDTGSILGFLPVFQMNCDTNRIHECAAMWLFHFSRKTRRSPPQRTYLSVQLEPRSQKGKLTSYCEVVNFLLTTYATDDIIAAANMDIMKFEQPAGQSAVGYAQALWTKGLRFGPVNNEYRLKGICNEGLRKSIRQRFRSYWAKNK